MTCMWPGYYVTLILWSLIIVTIWTWNLWPYSWGSRRNVQPIMPFGTYSWSSRWNVWPEIPWSISTSVLDELVSLCLLGSLFSPVLKGVLSWGIFPSSSLDGRIIAPPTVTYSLRTGILGEFGSLSMLGSLFSPFFQGFYYFFHLLGVLEGMYDQQYHVQ